MKVKKRKQKQCAIIVDFPGHGGFPVKNISHWKINQQSVGDGALVPVVSVYFKRGGFVDLPPSITQEDFTSMVFNYPY